MKDNIKPFDVSILSTYMGKWLTALIAVFVVGVAVSAWMTIRSGERDIVMICVAFDGSGSGAETFEPLRSLVASETRRSALMSACDETAGNGFDLYIMPTTDFLRVEGQLGLEALFEIVGPGHSSGGAVLIARPDDDVDLASLVPGEVTFGEAASVNGFLQPMSLLEEAGFRVPDEPGAIRFSGVGANSARVVLNVLRGRFRVAGCSLSDLSALVDAGVIGREDFEVLSRRSGLPEQVIACRVGTADYFRSKLKGIAVALQSQTDGKGTTPHEMALRLLRADGIQDLRPVSPSAMAEARKLYGRYSTFFEQQPD